MSVCWGAPNRISAPRQSEEDKQLQDELEMLVERLGVSACPSTCRTGGKSTVLEPCGYSELCSVGGFLLTVPQP